MTQLLAPQRRDATPSLGGRLRRYFNVIYALMMHDIKNRFFGSGLGQIVMILWPFVHIVVLLAIYYFTDRPHPFGDSLIQYSAVSIFPFIIFLYVGRWIVMSAAQNKSFLQYPIIKPLDILVSRTILETISITIVGILLIIVVMLCDSDAMPKHPDLALEAVGATIFLAASFGFLNAPFAFIIPIWIAVVSLFTMLMYASSGILFVASNLPERIRYYLAFNPLLHCVEWFRMAYYDDYPRDILDRAYVVEFGLVMMTVGLILLKALKRAI